ncbi:MAG: FAD-dependent oxidoreductase [Bacilli bacterium]|nr:FAD-dependent oxidoreductase [Bacilli bacterium]
MYDSIIIGCGPAGMTAALYLLRAGKKVILLERESIGGQVAKSPRLENFPSITSIAGEDFASQLFDQITDLGASFEVENGMEVIKKPNGTFTVKTDFNEYEGKTVVLATGCEHKKLGLAREDELVGHGISYCAVCDGAFFAKQDVIIIGDANTALQYAISLSDICTHVQIATLFDHFFADEILIERIKHIENISYRHNLASVEFLGENEIEGVLFEDTQTKEKVTYKASGVFICIGQQPDNERFKGIVDLDERGFILANDKMETKTPGVYAVGDCRRKGIRQVITATSDGAIAGVEIAKYLSR